MILRIYEEGVWKDVSNITQIGLNNREAKDESLASLQFVLAPLSSGEPLTPGTMFRAVKDDGTAIDDYVLVSDQVSVATKGTPSYAHSVQCVQAVRSLSFKVVRGADYTQPYSNSRKGAYVGCRFFLPVGTTIYDPTTYIYPFSSYSRRLDVISSKEKVLTAKVTLEYGHALKIYTKANIATLNEAHFDVYVYSKKDGAETNLFAAMENATMGVSVTLNESQIGKINAAIEGGYDVFMRCVAHPEDYSYAEDSDTRNGFASARMEVTTRYYTYFDVLNDLREMAINRSCKGIWRTDLKEDVPYYMPSDPNDSFYKFLTETTSPDFQFQQNMTLYECVAEVFRSFEAKPTIVNGVLGEIRYNEIVSSAENKIDGTLSKTADVVSASTDNRRAQRLVTPYQHGSKRSVARFPLTGYAKPRCKSMGVPNSDDWYFMTQNGINAVKSLRIPGGLTITVNYMTIDTKSNVVSVSSVSCDFPNAEIDLADMVYDDVTYNSLNVDSGQSEKVEATQSNSLQYTQEDDGIYVGKVGKNFFGQQSYTFSTVVNTVLNRAFGGTFERGGLTYNSVSKVEGSSYFQFDKPWTYQMACEYFSISKGNVAIESPKDKGYGFHNMITDYHRFMSSMTLAQGSGVVSLERMGANMLGTACMTGEDTKTWSYQATTLSGEKPLTGMWIKDSNGDMWVVQASKSTLIRKGLWKSELVLSKNFNKTSDRISLDRNPKMSVISQDLVLMSEGIMVEYAYLTQGEVPESVAAGDDYCFYPHLFQRIGQIGSGISRIACDGVLEMAGKKTFLPLVPYASGNCLCFEANFKSPITAGNKVIAESNWYGTSLMSKPVIYADRYGFGDSCSIHIVDLGASLDYSSYPESSFEDNLEINTDYGLASIRDLSIKKKPNDIFGFNYEVCFLPYGDTLVVYPGFADGTPLTGDTSDGLALRVIYPGEAPYVLSERAPRGTEVAGLNRLAISIHADSHGWEYPWATVTLEKRSSSDSKHVASKDIAGWQLSDRKGNIVLACNSAIQKGKAIEDSVRFEIFGSHKRL